MKQSIILSIFYLLVSVSFAQVPVSDRSKKAVERCSVKLAPELQSKGLALGNAVFIRIFKEEKQLEVWMCGGDAFCFVLFETYKICTYGEMGIGPKLKQGDGKAPEGFYFVNSARMNPWSRFHLSFNLGYPNTYDRVHGYTGSALMVHGNCVSIGCYAMTNKRIEEIYTLTEAALNNGQPFFRVHVFPFKMSEKKMNQYRSSQHFSFWKNLKEGYDWFENKKIPPNVIVQNRQYALGE